MTEQGRFGALFETPHLYLYDFDVEADTATFREMSPESYAASPFLDARMSVVSDQEFSVGLTGLIELYRRRAAGVGPRPLQFIFHTGYCCSTLLSRYVDELPTTLVLREPLALSRLAGLELSDWEGEAFTRSELFDLVLCLMSRTFGEGQTAIAKLTHWNLCLVERLLAANPETRGLFMYASLEDTLAAHLKSWVRRSEARKWGTRLVETAVAPAHRPKGVEYFPDAWIIALLWHELTTIYADAARGQYGERLRSLDCNLLLESPAEVSREVGRQLGVELDATAPSHEPLQTYSKALPEMEAIAYTTRDREAELERCRRTYADELGWGVQWAQTAALANALELPLPRPLLERPLD